ncbi:MAG: methyltransferase domain-containing protein [Dehalococcoidia bacterium]
MTRFADPTYLLREQYRDDSNLSARIALHERFSTNAADWYRWLFDHLSIGQGQVVVEVGCGNGTFWLRNAVRLPACELLLSDLSLGMVAGTRRRLLGRAAAPRFAVLDAQALPLRPGSVDLVIANHMLYHVPDVERALREIRRVLRPDGRLVAATNGHAHLRELDGLLARLALRSERHADAERFGLETGPPQLAPFFSNVDLLRYEDSLAVTESQPLVDYVLSVAPAGAVTEAALRDLRSHIDRTIAHEGAFHLSKDVGVLVASA